jgi:hypothetical protein
MPQDFTAEAKLSYLRWVDDSETGEAAFVRTLREYVAGEQPTYTTERQKAFLGLKAKDADHLFAHNLCALVIDAVVERLMVERFELKEEVSLPDDANPATLAERWWEDNRMDAGQDDVYEAACRDGAAYVMVDWDSGEQRPRWTVNTVWDGTQGVKLLYNSNDGKADYALKQWTITDSIVPGEKGRVRRTYYFPDRVEKYITTKDSNAGLAGTKWEPTQDPGDPGWPIVWRDARGEPLGLPVFAFENIGGSEIAQLLPIQDMLNKSDLDLVACADSSGFRLLYASGVSQTTDPVTGEEKALQISPGQLVRMSDPAARLGAIEPVDSNSLIRTSKYWVETAAGVTRTPQYLFQALGAEMPSGESLKMQEVGLVHKCERKQRVWGNVWENVIYLSAKLYNLYGGGAVADVPISCEWLPAEMPADPLSEESARAATRKVNIDAGLPLATILRREGWTDDEIAAMEADRQREEAAKTSMAAALLDEARRNFDAGVGPGTTMPESGNA